jgi:hypothetical protein
MAVGGLQLPADNNTLRDNVSAARLGAGKRVSSDVNLAGSDEGSVGLFVFFRSTGARRKRRYRPAHGKARFPFHLGAGRSPRPSARQPNSLS